jgi:hypothetical protein
VHIQCGCKNFSLAECLQAFAAADHFKEGVKMSGFDEMIRNEIRKAREKERQKGEMKFNKEREKNKKLSDCLSEIKSLLEMGRVDEAYKLAGNHKYAS